MPLSTKAIERLLACGGNVHGRVTVWEVTPTKRLEHVVVLDRGRVLRHDVNELAPPKNRKHPIHPS